MAPEAINVPVRKFAETTLQKRILRAGCQCIIEVLDQSFIGMSDDPSEDERKGSADGCPWVLVTCELMAPRLIATANGRAAYDMGWRQWRSGK